ncbi:hypothetical protein PG999_011636 [Apiospora kogelbergensis]|uniref:Uncharacterized protein n=1 Tax=Apiospora kogelbergensis TaxID=1337665 RepID=A0AAW0QL12_9PEZI
MLAKNSIPKRFLRRLSSGGKSGSNGSTRTKSEEFDTPAVAVDHQNYYFQQHRHDTIARTSKSSAQTPPGRESPAFRSPEYGGDLSTTQTRPPAKITGIRRPGPRHHVTAPVAATGSQKQVERDPTSTRANNSKAGYQERQTERGSPEGTRRRSPRDVSPPNFSRKTTTPSPEKGRSRSNSKTSAVPTVTLEAAEPVRPLDGGYILQAKTYTPPTQTTIISVNQPQTSYFSPFTESESGSSNGDSLSIASSSMGKSLPSPLSTPSQSPVVTRHISPGRKHGNSSSSNASNQRERYPNPSLPSSLEKELPLLPASVYQPTTSTDIEVKGRKKNPRQNSVSPYQESRNNSEADVWSTLPFCPSAPYRRHSTPYLLY